MAMGEKKCEACGMVKKHSTEHYRIIVTAGPRSRIFWAARCRACEAQDRAIPVPVNPLSVMAR